MDGIDGTTMSYYEKGFVSIWVGTLACESHKKFREEWIEERYDLENEDAVALSKFMEVYQTNWYDHDFQDAFFVSPSEPFRKLIDHCTFSKSYRKQVLQRADRKGISRVNTVICILDLAYSEIKAAELDHLPLTFLGAYRYTSDLV